MAPPLGIAEALWSGMRAAIRKRSKQRAHGVRILRDLRALVAERLDDRHLGVRRASSRHSQRSDFKSPVARVLTFPVRSWPTVVR